MDVREDILLKTKISIPNVREHHVNRDLLIGKVAAGTMCRLSTVCAPAGFGKTTLLSQWAHAGGRKVAWISLDERDNDLRRFWRYVAYSFEAGLSVALTDKLFPLLAAHSKQAVFTYVDVLLNELADDGRPVALVLDDYHVISNEAIRTTLTHFIDYLPSSVHVCLASRAEPDFASSPKWHARGELHAIGSSELLFTEADAAAWYGKSIGRPLTAEWIRTVVDKTEGWAAGLQLAAIAWRTEEGTDEERRLDGFTGMHRQVTDYLLAEVLSGLPEDLREFLLCTSVLRRLSAGVCDELTGRRDSLVMLDRLKRLQLFIVPLEPTESWYRYHHLFADGLRSLLMKRSEAEWVRLHETASRWYASRGEIEEAIEHALEAKIYDWAAECLNDGVMEALGKGEFGTLLRWFGQFPPSYPFPRRLALLYGFVLTVTESFEAADRMLSRLQAELDRMPESGERGELTAGLFFVKANLAFSTRNYDMWFAYAETIQERLPEDPVFFDFNYNPNEPFVRNTVFGLKGVINQETIRVSDRIIAILESHGWQHSRFCKYIMQAVAEGFYEMNELERCRDMLLRVERGGNLARTPGLYVPHRLTMARLEWAEGRTERARAVVEEAAERMGRQAESRWVRLLRAYKARMDIAEGHIDESERTLADMSVVLGQRPSSDRMLEFVTLARLLLARGEASEACTLLERLRSLAAGEEWIHVMAEISVVRSLAEWRSGNRKQSLHELEDALRHGGPNSYVRTVLDEGAALSEPLAVYTGQPTSDEATEEIMTYAKRLLDMLPKREAAEPASPAFGFMDSDPLTPKEIEILGLLRQGQSNRQIAERLKLKLGTVKVYTNRIYSKLGVSSRVQAVLKMQQAEDNR